MADPRHRSQTRWCLALGLAASLVAPALLGSGCGFFHDKSKLQESKRVSSCRSDARKACRARAKQDESLDVDECVSERAWQCALGEPEATAEPPNDQAD
jgi:hypothetical protein